MEITHDGGRSWSDWTSRAAVAHVTDKVYIGNFEGAKRAMAEWPADGAVLNVSTHNLDGADGTLGVKDEPMGTDAAHSFMIAASDKLEAMREAPWVLVNCVGGINRSSAAVLAWMVRHRGYSRTRAKKILREAKAKQARRLQFKSRYQSYKPGAATRDLYAWPTFAGGASRDFDRVLSQL